MMKRAALCISLSALLGGCAMKRSVSVSSLSLLSKWKLTMPRDRPALPTTSASVRSANPRRASTSIVASINCRRRISFDALRPSGAVFLGRFFIVFVFFLGRVFVGGWFVVRFGFMETSQIARLVLFGRGDRLFVFNFGSISVATTAAGCFGIQIGQGIVDTGRGRSQEGKHGNNHHNDEADKAQDFGRNATTRRAMRIMIPRVRVMHS